MEHRDHEAEASHTRCQPSVEELKAQAELAVANIPKVGLLRIKSSHRQDYVKGVEDPRTVQEFQERRQSMELDSELDIEKKSGAVSGERSPSLSMGMDNVQEVDGGKLLPS